MKKDKISYRDALAEIESIVESISSGELEVDELSEKVKRASFLINYCKIKLKMTEEEISNISKNSES